jgi:hypothetical protein
MKEIRFSEHSLDKLDILSRHEMMITKEFLIDIVNNPDQLEIKEESKKIAQKTFNNNLVIRVVYREFTAFILIITIYPEKKNRYEKNNL